MVKKLLRVPTDRKRGVHSSKRKGWVAWLKEMIWPSMGWKATAKLLVLKLRREAATPHKVAFGVAIGVGISFLPLPGLGLVVAALFAWGLRASIAAAMIGQVVGNPWTFPIIWWSTYGLGKAIWPGYAHYTLVPLHELTWEYIGTHIPVVLNNLVIPLLIGGGVLGGVLALLVYAVVYWELLKIGKKKKARRRDAEKK